MGKTTGSRNTVWCSAAWNYEYKSLPLATAYPVIGNQGVAASAVTYDKTGTGNDGTGANILKGDLGFCCYDIFIGYDTFKIAEFTNLAPWETEKLN